jgi:large subunit ribosomal protein L9
MKTEVILTSNIVGLGAESDHVKVAPGYARNYLFPQRMAIPLTQANKRHIEALQKRRAEREAHEFNTMSELSKSLTNLICVITVKAGDDGKMFGTVTSGMIADQLKSQFDVSLDKRKIHLEQPIRALGEHEVELHLHPQVKGVLKVRVESSTPIAAPAETQAPTEGKREGHKTEKRGRRPEGDRPHRTERTHKAEKAETAPAAKTAGTEKEPRAARTPRTTRPARTEKPVRTEKPAKAQKTAKAE